MKILSNFFKITSYCAFIGWAILIITPSSQLGRNVVVAIAVILLSAIYTYLICFGKKYDSPDVNVGGHFLSLKGVINLFKSPRAVLAGWIHYLAFDLMIGLFIVVDAEKYAVPHWMLIPCLLLTLMFGPAGLLVYVLLRAFFTDGSLIMSFF